MKQSEVRVKDLINAYNVAEGEKDISAIMLGLEASQQEKEKHAQRLLKHTSVLILISKFLSRIPDDLTIEISDSDQELFKLVEPFLPQNREKAFKESLDIERVKNGHASRLRETLNQR